MASALSSSLACGVPLASPIARAPAPRTVRCCAAQRPCTTAAVHGAPRTGVPRTQLAHCRGARVPLKPCAAIADPEVQMQHMKTFRYGGGKFSLAVTVLELGNGSQHVRLATDHPSNNLILHWGVEGGKDYQGGWRLPKQRPSDTVEYKQRALQTRWRGGKGEQTMEIDLDGDEASDHLNFVLKDDATATWYDCNGSNFQAALRSSLRSMSSMDDFNSGSGVLTLDEVEEVPEALAGKWSYIMWEAAGCPSRSKEDADAEYRTGIKELQACLCRGKTVDELWKVANGEIGYKKFKAEFIDAGPRSAPPPQQQQQQRKAEDKINPDNIPDDLVAKRAYQMWEGAGRKDGADFSQKAREAIAAEVRGGSTAEDVKNKVLPKSEAPREAKAAAPQQQDVQLGESIGMPKFHPMDLIKREEAPLLSIDKKSAQPKPLDALVQKAALSELTSFRRVYTLNDGAQLLCVVARSEDEATPAVSVTLTSDSPIDLVLHWGVGKGKKREWTAPPVAVQPTGTLAHAGGIAVETPLLDCVDMCDDLDDDLLASRVPLQRITLALPTDAGFANVQFVLRSADQSMWLRDGEGNFQVPLPRHGEVEEEEGPGVVEDGLTRAIIDSENTNAWTLMHRFNRSADLLQQTLNGGFDDPAHATAALYVWLRYSSTRHLTWQRNYNTQPRFLSGAQDNLTNLIARAHKELTGEAQEWVRLMLSTVGRGGDGQKIRDEILNIMHRNNVKEVKGTWMEAWHQKLHNNTTPDDVPICEAYLAFLKSNGDAGTYWRVLSDAGITKARMEGFDRAVPGDPEFLGHIKDALIGEFQNYLGILKAVHSGADLQNAAKNAGHSMPAAAKGHLGYVLANLGSSQVLPLAQSAVAARLEIAPALPGNRDLLYLDLALEDVVRGAAERGASALGIGAAAFVGPLLQNLVLTRGDNEELCYCLLAWQALPQAIQCGASPDRSDALRATAVVDRLRRALGELSNDVVERLEPVSTAIGRSCGIESWAVDLFAEEVVRGGPAFAVSLVLSTVEPALRRAAELGSWQIISPNNVTGRVVKVAGLQEVQEEVYTEATILVATRVSGEEEVPEGCVAVLTPDAPDILSHVSVRARNMKVLFATCHEPEPLKEIADLAGKVLTFETTAAGSVVWEEATEEDLTGEASSGSHKSKLNLKIDVPKWCGKWAVPMTDFADGVVGAKSKNLLALRSQLPDWVRLPSSVTLPFGCFEEALDDPVNKDIKERLKKAAKQVSDGPAPALLECREIVMGMKVPPSCRKALTAAMEDAGISVPESEERWAAADEALIGVWASKFNDRAYYSMRKVGLNFMDLRMAVVVQRVVQARYAFVIHTNNPSTGATDEIYAELVKGLGETLVSGLVPGSALCFSSKKATVTDVTVIAFPSKSEGMFVRESLIFRSDSNGEDLAGYAGAGLYESITMDPTLTETVDYSADAILVDEAFRQELLGRICQVGLAIEESMGSPQDVEGVVDADGNITVVQTRPQV